MNVKVDTKVKPVHFTKRKEPELIIGNDYYVSFGCNIAQPCTLFEIHQGDANELKSVTIGIKKKSGEYDGRNIVFADEIGLTPEEAVINTRTW